MRAARRLPPAPLASMAAAWLSVPVLAATTLPAAVAADAKPAFVYKVVVLGAGWGSYGHAINRAGHVAGRLIPGAGDHAFLHADGMLTGLGTLPGYDGSVATGINASDQVVGAASGAGRTGHAFLYGGGTMRDIGTLAGGTTAALDINDAGDIVGSSVVRQQGYQFAFLYRNGVMRNLGSLPGSDRSVALAINNRGEIAGSSGVGLSDGPTGEQTHAVVWKNGNILDLGTLGGLSSDANDINDRGEVTGYSTFAGGDGPDRVYGGFIWSHGKMRGIGAPPGGSQVMPLGMNNRGRVVGIYAGFNQQRAFLYGYRGGMHDLTALVDAAQGWTITAAYDINDAGQIAGEACDPSRLYCTAVRLDPIVKSAYTDSDAALLPGPPSAPRP